MKAIHLKCAAALAFSLSACACIPSAQEPVQTATPTPAPVAAPAPTPAPAPSIVPVVNEPVFDNYLDAPQSPGTWRYAVEPGETFASYGTDPARPDLLLSCSKGRFAIVRRGDQPQQGERVLSVTTETATRQYSATPYPPVPGTLIASIDVNDGILDAMAITKGRVAIGVEGMRTLYVPAWVEISRVIEDCR